MEGYTMRATLYSLTLALLAQTASAQIPAIDWKAQQAETLRHHRSLIQIRSTPATLRAMKLWRSNI
jgi:hypothetical protein